jgi:hypothetical protein
MGPEMEKVVANALNLLDVANDGEGCVVVDALVVVLMLQNPAYC